MDLTPKDEPAAGDSPTTLAGSTPPAGDRHRIDFEAPDYGEPPAEVAPAEVAEKLEMIGHTLNRLHHPPAAPDLWVFLDDELDAIAGPAARELNKRGAVIRQVLQHLDLMAVIFGLVGYLSRQLEALRADDEPTDDEPADDEHRGPGEFGLGDPS